jgi:hypothetical protein
MEFKSTNEKKLEKKKNKQWDVCGDEKKFDHNSSFLSSVVVLRFLPSLE